MYTPHELTSGAYTLLPPIEFLGKGVGHASEAILLNMTLPEYFKHIVSYKSAEIVNYHTFISYTLNESDIKKLASKLNTVYRKLS